MLLRVIEGVWRCADDSGRSFSSSNKNPNTIATTVAFDHILCAIGVGVGVGVGVVARVTSPNLPAPSVFSECLLVLVVGELGVLQLFLHCDVVLHTNARGVGSSLNPNPTCGALERRCCVR